MLKKITPLMLAVLTTALTLALAPAQDAAAWQRVCMKLPLWKAWYSAKFYVVYDFDTRNGRLPGLMLSKAGHVRIPLPSNLGGDPEKLAQAFRVSPTFAVNQSRCVSIKHLSYGSPFLVYVQVAGGTAAVCETHHTNPNPWYRKQKRPYKDLWYDAWGASLHPRCAFVRER